MSPTRIRIFVLLSTLLHAGGAWSYVDPGSGMLLVQGLITVVVAAIAFIKNPWKNIKALIERLRKRKDA